MNGDEVFKQLKEINPKVKIILVTMLLASDKRIQELLDKGADGVVFKPFMATDVVRKVEEVLGPL